MIASLFIYLISAYLIGLLAVSLAYRKGAQKVNREDEGQILTSTP